MRGALPAFLRGMKNNLSTLSILHFVYGGFVVTAGVVVLFIMLALGEVLQSDWLRETNGDHVPRVIGGLFSAIGWGVFVFLCLKGAANIISGSLLGKARGRLFSQIVAGFNCLNIPVGITLGIFTLVELGKEDVKRLYLANEAAPVPPGA